MTTAELAWPHWLSKIGLTLLSVTLTWSATRFYDNTVLQQRTLDRIEALQKAFDEMHAEQKVNTLYRQHMQDFEEQWRLRDFPSIMNGQDAILREQQKVRADLAHHEVETEKARKQEITDHPK